ncbi:MAG: CPBP family intramembrane metalloprotease [Planctomycetes bacterium]|nr:CPBP family intramembrane metalloprotease [Planctomycetota bacterium]
MNDLTQTKPVNLWLGVIPAMLVPGAASLIYYVLLAETGFAFVVYGMAKIFLVIWPVAACWLWEKNSFKWSRFDVKKHLKAMPLGFITGGLIAALIIGIFKFSPWSGYIQQFSGQVRGKAEDMKIINYYVPFAILISLGHSLLEEYYWRWYVYGRMRKLVRPITAYLIASFTFAAHHYVVLGCFFPIWATAILGTSVAIGGGLWCWMFCKQRSLAGCWVSHIMVDGVIFYVGYNLIGYN